MAKTTKFFRVATSGSTFDNRLIQPEHLIQMAKNYDPKTREATVNIEHIKSSYPGGAFGVHGKVLALKTEPVTLNVGGVQENRTALLAQVEVHDSLLDMHKDGQKIYTSIEINPKLGAKGEAYLDSLAFTDNPASLGVEQMKFRSTLSATSPLAFTLSSEDSFITAPEETAFSLAEMAAGDGAPASPAATASATDPDNDGDGGIMEALGRIFAKFAAKPAAPAADPVTPPAAAPAITFAALIADPEAVEMFTTLRAAFEANSAANGALTTQLAELREAHTTLAAAHDTHLTEYAVLKAELETPPAGKFTSRPRADGGAGKEADKPFV